MSDADAGSLVPLVVGAALSACGLAAAPLAGEVLRRVPRRVPVFFARWGFSHALLATLCAFGAALVLPTLARAAGAGEAPGILPRLYLSMAILGAAAACAALFAQRLHPEGLGALGLARGGNPRAVVAGVLAYALVLPGFLGAGALWPLLAERLGFEPAPQEVLVGIEGLRGAALAQAVVLAVAVGPLLEETVFRGFLQPLLVQNLREKGGVALTSALFAALHGPSAFGPLFVLSLLLGAIQLRTRRLAGAWCVHGLHNAATLAFVLLLPEWSHAIDLSRPT